ncbi:MAG: prepilin-type N-terminal cleavage/methylation domain-containing protein [Actinomycetota bacterium]
MSFAMSHFLSARRSQPDRGFTLLEVMVVVLVIGILLAVGIPTYLGARERAHDRAAQQTARTSINTAISFFADDGNFLDANYINLGEEEPGFTWVQRGLNSTHDRMISVWWPTDNGDRYGSAVMSETGTCWFILANANAPTLYGSSDTAACRGNNVVANATDPSW